MKTKRTYNLSSEAVAMVKSLVEDKRAAPSQDALVERAIRLFERQQRDLEDARRWAAAAAEPGFVQEQEQIAAEFLTEDLAGFPD